MKHTIVVLLLILLYVVGNSLGQSNTTREDCPARSGIYAFTNRWIELKPMLAKKVKRRAAFPAHDRMIAEYPGYTSSSILPNDVLICGTGIPCGYDF